MKTTFLSFLLLVTMLLILFSDLSAQRWIGLHYLNYQNNFEQSVDSASVIANNTGFTTIDNRRQLALGAHYRKINERNGYYEIAATFDRHFTEELSVLLNVDRPFQPTKGERTASNRFRLGYFRGKMFPLVGRLNGDVGAGLSASMITKDTVPLTTANFHRTRTSFGLELHLRAGLNYQVHPRVNIGYSIMPAAFSAHSYVQRTRNPILTEAQQMTDGGTFETDFFKHLLGWRKFRISYVLNNRK